MATYGHNRGYIDELYQSYRADPQSVSAAWREFFEDWRPDEEAEARRAPAAAPRRHEAERNDEPNAGTPPQARQAPGTTRRGEATRIEPQRGKPAGPAAPPAAEPTTVEPLRGAAARIVQNMERSLGVPTATSARTIPVKVLEENRRLINQHQALSAAPKISFTHLIAWALVRALVQHPRLNSRLVSIDGQPHRESRSSIRLGLAVDLERNGERVLVVPNIRGAEGLDFPAFVAAYDDLVARARANRLTVDDFAETTVTLTNPGMLGTALSVPRLMEGQGTIVGVGAIGYPAEYAGMAPEVISELGLAKVMTVTSTYDHRVIQGAESGAFLAHFERLLHGEATFYERIFADLGVPHDPIGWSPDQNAALAGERQSTEAIAKQAGVLQFIRSYRVRGHLLADLDPLGYAPERTPELELSHYGLTIWDLDRQFIAGGLGGCSGTLKLREILDTLEQTYCRHIGVEYMHIQDPQSRHWLQDRMERTRNSLPLPRELQVHILERLNAAEAFESFLATNYVAQKRFSLEGAETLIPMLDLLLRDAAGSGIEDVLIGMAHRGRLNVLVNIIGKSAGQIFREFEDIDPATTHGSGDVKYHLGASGVFRAPDGREVRVAVASNPSHLEAVDPVVEGMVRARQDRRGDLGREHVLPVLIHGDAAFSGQGVVAETLNLSQLKGYRTGGTVHIVIDNQIGFTTGPADLRSSHYPTDVAKMVRAPIFHVNGDRPEDAVRVIRLALAFRQAFKRDVVVDLVCYRRWGHNEADDPSYTHPILYEKIQKHRSVRKLYTEQLLRSGDLDPETAERALEDFRRRLGEMHEEVQQAGDVAGEPRAREELEALEGQAQERPDTALAPGTLLRILDGLERTPPDFEVHPKLARQLAKRRERLASGEADWALAETLAFGSLVLEGTPVRLSGEDTRRGTFSQRHATLFDYHTAEPWVPLDHLDAGQARFQVYDSLLSEFAVLGFEYGYSVEHPRALVLWEAQFGDFANGAQVTIDQFLASAEDKWGQQSGVVLLLPHGYEGQGPEHSSARLERFLQLAARGNLQVVYPTTPAQYMHVLRAQARAERRRPLVVMTPKSLLRHRASVSSDEELARGPFHEVLDDPSLGPGSHVRRLVLCSGKVFYDLAAAREEHAAHDVALCRLEQLYPFPGEKLVRLLERWADVADVVWAQEEPRNMGAWTFILERMQELLPAGRRLSYVGRPRAASPASGSHRRHAAEQAALVREALLGDVSRTVPVGTPMDAARDR